MTDPRESKLATLVMELSRVQLAQKESKRLMAETIDEMKREINILAAEIESGQGELELG